MPKEIVLYLPVRPLVPKREIKLKSGEVVTIDHVLKTTRFVNERYVGTENDLFYVRLKPGDY